jgi:hypothetical protein
MESVGCVLEAAIFGTGIWLVWALKTSRRNKATVVVAFGFRLL